MSRVYLNLKIFILFICCSSALAVKVCDTFFAYGHEKDKRCSINSNTDKNATEIVRGWGFTAEEFSVKTKDDYILTIIKLYDKVTQKTPLVFGHGEEQNALRFVMRDKKSLAYYFGKQGYEIYLISFRGSKYSRMHSKKSCKDAEFWDFSFHELGVYDLCAVLSFVRNKSGKKPIYIGDSTGANAGLVYASMKPDKAKENLSGMVLYGPMAHLKNIKSYYKLFAYFTPMAKNFLDKVFHGRFEQYNIRTEMCSHYAIQMYHCEFLKSLLYGDDFDGLDPHDLPLSYFVNNDAVSVRTAVHYAQLINCGEFKLYDYGEKKNYEVYGSKLPPKYNTSAISVPVKIFAGKNDWLATLDNIDCLYKTLPENGQCGVCPIQCDKFSHADFQQHKDIEKLLFEPTKQAIEQICEGKCHS